MIETSSYRWIHQLLEPTELFSGGFDRVVRLKAQDRALFAPMDSHGVAPDVLNGPKDFALPAIGC